MVEVLNTFSTSDNNEDALGSFSPIAVCGIALRLPGGISNPAEFWEFLLAKGDARARVPLSRYSIASHYSEFDKDGLINTEYGYYLDHNPGDLDTSFFSFTKAELEYIDPHQRHLLEVVQECFDSAGEASYRGKNIGCYVGSFSDDWIEILYHDLQMYGKYPLAVGGDFAIPNRISFEYDLRGPSVSVRTACSSAMVALDQACGAMARGECDAAIVGGCQFILSPTMTGIMSARGVLSGDGASKSFDAAADGYGRGEAINAVYLKPLAAALRNRNPIRAIIRGCSTNSDGKSAGFTVPSAAAQQRLIEQAYRVAGIHDLSQTPYVECHGTGTSVGDPIEAIAVSQTMGERKMFIGSVKPNVGHSEGASGLTSFIKAVLALENRTIPPNIRFDTPSPKIPFSEGGLTVPTEPTPWPGDRSLRAGVNSFGLGGVNVHTVIESAESLTPSHSPSLNSHRGASLLCFSANTPESLAEVIKNNHAYLDNHPEALPDLSYTLAARRVHLPFRAASVVLDDRSMRTSVFPRIPAQRPDIVMVFTGQGAQWPGMGAKLLATSRTFRENLEKADRLIRELPEAPSWSIVEEIQKNGVDSNLHKASYSQPICTAIQIALVDDLVGVNVSFVAVVGHSSGELAAAYASGRLTSREAIICAYYRGLVSEEVKEEGAMFAVGMGTAETLPFLRPGVVIACENSPASVTLSGDLAAVEETMSAIRASRAEVLVRRLRVDTAYHSPHMKKLGERYRAFMDRYLRKRPVDTPPDAVVFASAVKGQVLSSSVPLDSEYWQENLESPVLFLQGMQEILDHFNRPLLFLEIGPHSALAGPIRQIIDERSLGDQYLSCLSRSKPCDESFLTLLGELYGRDVPLDFDAMTDPDGTAKVLTDIPMYPWHHPAAPIYEPRSVRDWKWAKFPRHELLGIRVAYSTDDQPSWHNVLFHGHVHWLHDHRVTGNVVFPAAGYIAMGIEAVRQIDCIEERGFQLKRVQLSSAMLLDRYNTTEILTSLRKQPGGSWYEFIISSHNGASWVEHCVGQVRRGARFMPRQEYPRQDLLRSIDTTRWYRVLGGAGVDYGASFQGARSLRSSTSSHLASAQVVSTIKETVYYPIHPTKLDACFQTVYAARYQGLEWKIDRLPVPTELGEINIVDCAAELDCTTWAQPLRKGVVNTRGKAFSPDGRMVLSFDDTILRPVGTQAYKESDSGPRTRLHWGKMIEFLPLSGLITAPLGLKEATVFLGQLTKACIAKSISLLGEKEVTATTPHLGKYHNWLRVQQKSFANGSCVEELGYVFSQAITTSAAPCAQAMVKVVKHIVALCKGEIDPVEVLMSDNTLLEMYNFLNQVNRAPLFRALGHNHPGQRILEIGAGTGGTTAQILPEISHIYSTYTFTDISAAFFPAAKERFKSYRNIVFKTLDITTDPVSQGFEPGSFDLIIASNVLHATPVLHDTLLYVRRLLHRRGRLLLEELCGETKYANVVTGILSGWWAGEKDGRATEPYVSPLRWEKELQTAGFNGLDDLAFDIAPPFHNMAYMLASPRVTSAVPKNRTLLISDGGSMEIAILLQKQLRSRGYEVGMQSLDDPLPVSQDVVVLVDTVEPFFHSINSSQLSTYQSFMRNLQQSHSGALWVTRCSQMGCTDPRYSSTIGVARTCRAEFGIDLATCEVDTVSYNSFGLIIDVFQQFQARVHADRDLREMEYIIYESSVYVGRLLPFSMQDEAIKLSQKKYNQVLSKMVLNSDTREWMIEKRQPMLGEQEVEIEVDTAGVSYLDVLTSLETATDSHTDMGVDSAGVVRRIGSQVTGLSPGDRVISWCPGVFATSLIVPSLSCTRIPDDMSLEDASTLPLAFATAIYALIDIGQLRESHTILIHSASGGIGNAAIQISQMLGATIFVTPKTLLRRCAPKAGATGGQGGTISEKAEHIVEAHGIQRERIFDSHNSSFLHAIKHATKGRGVDLVLNSLSGELFTASCECVAPCGKLINLAKRPGGCASQMPLALFEQNVSHIAIDLLEYIRLQPVEGKRLFERVVNLYIEGKIHPISPVKIFPARDIQECLRSMQTRQHIGKSAVSFTGEQSLPTPTLPAMSVKFRSDSSYLLAGGLGGIGRGLARWMAEHDARYLVFLSRSTNKESHQELFRELRSIGCSVTAIEGSVCSLSDVEKAIAVAPVPLRGIFNLSMTLSDASLLTMTLAEWEAARAPKVTGTWNLHEASYKYRELDFFVLFSSMCGIIGMPGQANYASANTFMDAFVQYRRHHGLPASVIDIGAVEGIGHVAENPKILERSKWLEGAVMSQRELFQAISIAIRQSHPTEKPAEQSQPEGYVSTAQVITGFRNSSNFNKAFRNNAAFLDRRLATYSNLEDEGRDNTGADETQLGVALQRFVSGLSTAGDGKLDDQSTAVFLAKEISKWIFDLLLKPVQDDSEIDLVRSLTDIGFDSLAAVELQSWYKATLGLEISVLEIMSSESLSALGEHALRGLKAKFAYAVNGE